MQDIKQLLLERAGDQEVLLQPSELKGVAIDDIPRDTRILVKNNGIEVSIGRTEQGSLEISLFQIWDLENWERPVTLPAYLRVFKKALETRQIQHGDVIFVETAYDGDGQFHVWYDILPTRIDLAEVYQEILSTHQKITENVDGLLKDVEAEVTRAVGHIETNMPDYDVALSFAGEDREYVAEVANILHQFGVKVFYDKYEEADLWGKDLYTHLDDVYRNRSRYCVIFISRHYKSKLWTNHERESAQARAFQERREYILPVRCDETDIPGMRSTTAYINLKDRSPADLAYLIIRKLGLDSEFESMVTYLKDYLPDYKIIMDGTDLVFESEAEQYHGVFPTRLVLEMYRANVLEEMFLLPGIVPH